MNSTKDADIGLGLLGLGLIPLLVLLFVWFVSGVVAALIAAYRGRSPAAFFFVTFFFLGPLGPGFALVAAQEEDGEPVGPPQPEIAKRKLAEGRRRFTCPRCGAESHIPRADTSVECWRCHEVHGVKPPMPASANEA